MNTWSDAEVELIVADYFQMLSLELTSKSYSKAAHRRRLLPLLNNRSEGSIEFKHQNISAVLIKLGQPYIKGYLPRPNFQSLLIQKVLEYLYNHPSLENLFQAFAEQPITQVQREFNFNDLIVKSPKMTPEKSENNFADPESVYHRSPIKINYLEREQKNAQLGFLGEQLVIDYENWFLKNNGKEQLADRIEWISKNDDGAGFDILSFNLDGTDKYIEVKTTKLGKETPFFFSKNELIFSQKKEDHYHLYRLFNFNYSTRIFTKKGSLDTICHSEAVNYRGWF